MQKHVTPKKRFGQNFLQDTYVITKIVQSIDLNPDDNVVEIGPGMGALTIPVLKELKHLNLIEIDREVISYLSANTTLKDRINLIEADALKYDFNLFGNKLRVIGNLPYNISTPLLFRLLDFTNIQDMHFMLQKEVVERICAVPGNKDYGKLSVIMQYMCKCEMLFIVPPESFYPAPKVDSAIVRLTPSYKNNSKIDVTKLNQLVSKAFQMRRKTIYNNLKEDLNKEDWIKIGIDENRRAEQLSLDEYLHIYQYIYN